MIACYMVGIASRFAGMNGWDEAQIAAVRVAKIDGEHQDRRADPRSQRSGLPFGKRP
jgi:hypothetical protein